MSELNRITIDGIEFDLPSGGGEVPENIVLHSPSEEEVEVPPIDADKLGGELPEHYENELYLANESTPSTPSPRDADRLGGQLPSYYATKNELDQIAKRQVMTNSRYHTCLVGTISSFAMISEVPQNAISGIVKAIYPLGYAGGFQLNTPCEIQRGLGTAYFNVDEIEYLRQYPTLAMVEWTVSD